MAEYDPQPYKIAVPDSALEDLKTRLSLAKLPSQFSTGPDGDDWELGAPVSKIKKLVEYWKDGFDWRKAEEKMNQLPNYRTGIEVEGFGVLDIHFVHQVSDEKGAIPLLFSHGWPGSFLEVTKLLPLLKGGDGHPAFHVVAPSLPNFGFSSGVTRKGFTLNEYAEVCNKLMLKLGYDKYVTQGGDWGYAVTRSLGLLYPDHVKASHINMILAHAPSPTSHPLLWLRHLLSPSTPTSRSALQRTQWFMRYGFGYNLLQSTKPATISFSLSDSPVGLLSWIYEKLHDWTDSYPWTPDEILTWVSVYYFSTAGPEASVRIYNEATNPSDNSAVTTDMLSHTYIPRVKLGVSHFPKEISCVPSLWVRTLGEVVFESERHGRGGHFAAWEQPERLVGDLRNMFKGFEL